MPQIYGKVNRALPGQSADATQLQPRISQRGDVFTIPLTQGTYPLADEGSYFKATNPTPGSAITHAATTAFSATAALFCLRNTDAEGAKRLYLDYVDIIVVTTPTTATSAQLAITLDNTNRYSSGGTTITPVNANMDSSNATISSLTFGAVVLTAASGSVRTVARQSIKTQTAPCLTVGDSIFINLGTVNPSTGLSSGAAAAAYNVAIGPCIIGGGDSLNFHVWYPASTVAPTFEFEMGWWER